MTRTVQAFVRALGDLPQRRVLHALIFSLLLTLILFMLSGFLLYHGMRHLFADTSWFGQDGEAMAGAAALIGMILGGWLLFRATAIMVIGLFADAIVADVESRHYPAVAGDARSVGLGRSLSLALASLVRLVIGNLVALPFYIALLITGIGTPILALLVNGLLLGRDLEAMVLARHPGLARLDRTARWSMGLLSAATFLVPVANLLAPVLGAAMAVHMIHLRKGPP